MRPLNFFPLFPVVRCVIDVVVHDWMTLALPTDREKTGRARFSEVREGSAAEASS